MSAPKKRFYVSENRECGDLIIELRDREQEETWTLIAEFYPHGWTNARHEAATLAARLNGEPIPSSATFESERITDLEQRVKKLEQGKEGAR
jgi:hypothetical protein